MIFTKWWYDRKESKEAVDTAEVSLQKALKNRENVSKLVFSLSSKGQENHFGDRLSFKLRSNP